ncbi:GNAT family N-acetyltransferase [Actinotalea sp.]|uniref:GNAT family N-acetyltransferase n=1 Tax=Actinotalea sp. TaxID=1872145 RepID=UPI00356358F6
MTPLPPGYRLVDLTEQDALEMMTLDAWAFAIPTDPATSAAGPLPVPWERARGVRDSDGALVASHSSYPYREFPVPGARVPVAGLTWVGVHPASRRRGLLRSMIEDHMSRSLGRGEPVSALYAAEPAIYGRFGYGLAAHEVRLRLPRRAALRDVEGSAELTVRLEVADPELHGPTVAALHAAVDRPGWADRDARQQAAFFHDPADERNGGEALRIAVVERQGTPLGYAFFRRHSSWEHAGPRGTVKVREVCVQEPAAARALWGVLLDLDLMATTEVMSLPVDDPLLGLLVDQRAAEPRWVDNLWVRVLDVRAALAARRYSAPVDVVLEVRDELLAANEGRWHLVGGPEGAEVTRTDRPADLDLDVRELGAVYLGGTSLSGLAAAGLVREHTAGAVHRSAVAFGWPVAPVSSWVW